MLDEVTRADIKTIGDYLEYSDADVIKLLVSQCRGSSPATHFTSEV